MSTRQLRSRLGEFFTKGTSILLRRELLIRVLAYKIQERAYGGLKTETRSRLRAIARKLEADPDTEFFSTPRIKPGTRLIREWHGQTHCVTVLEDGFEYADKRYQSLSEIARVITQTRWSGPLFFGLRSNGIRERKNG